MTREHSQCMKCGEQYPTNMGTDVGIDGPVCPACAEEWEQEAAAESEPKSMRAQTLKAVELELQKLHLLRWMHSVAAHTLGADEAKLAEQMLDEQEQELAGAKHRAEMYSGWKYCARHVLLDKVDRDGFRHQAYYTTEADGDGRYWSIYLMTRKGEPDWKATEKFTMSRADMDEARRITQDTANHLQHFELVEEE